MICGGSEDITNKSKIEITKIQKHSASSSCSDENQSLSSNETDSSSPINCHSTHLITEISDKVQYIFLNLKFF